MIGLRFSQPLIPGWENRFLKSNYARMLIKTLSLLVQLSRIRQNAELGILNILPWGDFSPRATPSIWKHCRNDSSESNTNLTVDSSKYQHLGPKQRVYTHHTRDCDLGSLNPLKATNNPMNAIKGKTTRHPHPKQNRMVHSSIYYNVSKFITVYYCSYFSRISRIFLVFFLVFFSYFSHIFLESTLFHCVKVAVTVCYNLQRIWERIRESDKMDFLTWETGLFCEKFRVLIHCLTLYRPCENRMRNDTRTFWYEKGRTGIIHHH